MTRCLSCNGILRPTDTACYSCGDKVEPQVRLKSKGSGFANFVSLTFFASLGLTGYSFFSDRTAPFAICLAASVILLFVKRSADQFTRNSKST